MFGQINREQKDALNKVTSQSDDMLSMVNEILQATQIEANEVQLNYSDQDIGGLLNELRTVYEVSRKEGGALLSGTTPPPNLPTIRTDPAKLKQILQNLINNAIKFTDEGSVIVGARYVSDENNIEFRVQDTGVGIAHDDLSIIFDMFRQADSSEARLYGGVGLGLFIVKKYTELLGGQVRVESNAGKGSTLTVVLPVNSEENYIRPFKDQGGNRNVNSSMTK